MEDRKRILSKISKINVCQTEETIDPNLVGEPLAAPENERLEQMLRQQNDPISFSNNYKVILTPIGEIVKEQILELENRYGNVEIKSYVIMPDHIHILIYLRMDEGAASGSPTLSTIIRAFKSITSRKCKTMFGIENMFQRSYADHIIRNREDYEKHLKYIHENPMRWYYKNMKLGEKTDIEI